VHLNNLNAPVLNVLSIKSVPVHGQGSCFLVFGSAAVVEYELRIARINLRCVRVLCVLLMRTSCNCLILWKLFEP